MRLVAIQEVYYASRTRRPGDEFEASEQDGRILKGIGKAKDAPKIETETMKAPPPPPAPASKQTQPPIPMQSGDVPPRKRIYRRRDMIAENP